MPYKSNFMIYKFILPVTLVFGSFLISCRSENSVESEKVNSDPIRISGGLSGYNTTKAENTIPIDEPYDITSGIFNLIYPASANSSAKTYATVNFDLSNDGIGFVSKLNGSELLWNEVTVSANNSFTLDNIPEQYTTVKNNPTTVDFTDSDNPYSAALLSDENDLLWGSAPTVRESYKTPVEFELHHKMSLLRIQVISEINLSEATVVLTNIVKRVSSFNRTTGTAIVGRRYEYDLEMVNPDKNLKWVTAEGNTYITNNFIIPPQVLQIGTDRTQLRITFTDDYGEKQTYSGYLPYSMSVEGENDESYASSLEFLAEKFLTIRTTIDTHNPVLEFAPVTYVDWVNKGKFTINGYQEGVYTSHDFMSLIEAIQTDSILNMMRYGYQDEKGWHFQIWSDIELDFRDIYDSLYNSDLQFDFILGTHIITVKGVHQTETLEISVENQEELVSILKGTYNN